MGIKDQLSEGFDAAYGSNLRMLRDLFARDKEEQQFSGVTPGQPAAQPGVPVQGSRATVQRLGSMIPREEQIQTGPEQQDPYLMGALASQETGMTEQDLELALSGMTNKLVMGDVPGLADSIEKTVSQMMKGSGVPAWQPLDPNNATEAEMRLGDAANFAGQASHDLMKRAMEIGEHFNMGGVRDAQTAEAETREALEDSNFRLETGMGRVEFEETNNRLAEVNEELRTGKPGMGADKDTLKKYADLQDERAAITKKLADAKAAAGDPNPMRMWSNLSGFQQFLFIMMNAIGSAAAAVSGGPTPLDVAFDMMERDYQSQKDAYQRLRDKQQAAQSAYSMAARQTDREVERAALAKNWMLQGAELRLQEAGLHAQAQQLRQHRESLMNNYRLSRHQTKVNERIAGVNAALTMQTNRINMALKAAKARDPRELPAGQAEKLGDAGTLRAEAARARKLFQGVDAGEAAVSMVPSPLTEPFGMTEGREFNAKRSILAHRLARAAEGARVTDQDVVRYEKGLPTSMSAMDFGTGLIDEREGEGVATIASRLVEFRAANFNVSKQYENFVNNYGTTPEEFLRARETALQSGRDFNWKEHVKLGAEPVLEDVQFSGEIK